MRIANLTNFRGFTLTELLVSLVISLFLLLGLLRWYIVIQSAYCYADTIAEMQNNVLHALHVLHDQIRTAGYIGCAKLEHLKIYYPSGWDINNRLIIRNNLQGYSNMTDIKSVLNNWKQGTTVIKVRKVKIIPAKIIKVQRQNMLLETTEHLNKGDQVVISDCRSANLTIISNANYINNKQSVTFQEKLKQHYKNNIQFGVLIDKLYYVGKTKRLNSLNQPIYALYEKNLTPLGSAEEIVDGIEDLQIRYAIKTKKLNYVSAGQIDNWGRVKGIQINLLFVSQKIIMDKKNNYYEYLGKQEQSQDGLLRQGWQFYLALRERSK